MGKIQRLDEIVANQIAAGEVVERPQSVAKELIENALDAGAMQIDILADMGGVSRLVVTDDGHGMEPEDAVLCFSRYATSKLRSAADLERIATFGFRGEALPSIAAVSKVRLLSRTEHKLAATEVCMVGGKVTHVGETGATVGTRIEVEDLFFNVPARRKFLKSERSECAAIEHVVRTAALSQPSVGFSLRMDGKQILDVRQAPEGAALDHPRRLERAIACLGEEVRGFIYPFSASTGLLSVEGYLVAPLVTRRDHRGIRLSINRRPVEDKQLVQAVKVAYRTLLEVGRFPICALNVTLNPELVDVNVHPQKLEVRFSDPSQVQGNLIRLLSQFLATTPWLKGQQMFSSNAERRESPVAFALRLNDIDAGLPLPQGGRGIKGEGDYSARTMIHPHPTLSRPAGEGISSMIGGAARYSDLRVLGQVNSTYLVLESAGAMVVVDQHAAHERVMFEKFRNQIRSANLVGQPLLFPITINLSSDQMAALRDHKATLLRYGLEVEPFGDSVALMKAAPNELPKESLEQVLKDTLSELLISGRPDALDELTDQVCASMACHGSVRAGQRLQAAEIDALLRQLDCIDYGAHCPHGRPVVRAISFTEMAKWFSRL